MKTPGSNHLGSAAWAWLLAAALAGVVAGCSHDPSAAPPGRGKTAAISVTVAPAEVRDVPLQVQGIGTVRAYSTVSVKSKIAGELAKVGFKEGDEVKSGDLIFLIDPRPYEGALEQARANRVRDQALLVKAQADFRRAEELLRGSVISPSDFDASRAAVDSLKATVLADETAIGNATVQLSYCYIHSPIDGRAGALLVNQGNIVKDLDTVMAVINQVKPIYMDFSVPEQWLPEIRRYMAAGRLQVRAAIPQHADREATGELEMINNEVDRMTGTILLRAQFPNRDELLWPGQFVEATLRLTVQTNVVVVPSEAIQDGQQGQYVCVVKPDQTIEFRPVEVGGSFAYGTAVKKGLQPHERVVTSGQLRLVPGAKVVIKGKSASPGDGPGLS